jgi:hypothetical protein
MSAEQIKNKETKKKGSLVGKIFSYLAIGLGIIIGATILFFVIKLVLFCLIYTFFASLITSWFGLDSRFSAILAIALTVATILIIPTIISFVFLGRRKKEVLAVGAGLLVVLTIAFYCTSDLVMFDRSTGGASKYYIKTMEGFKFSSTNDYDPALGIKYKAITSEAAKEYFLWKKTGKIGVPRVVPGKYFDMVTGEPICWYVQRPDNKIVLFSLPGYDPTTGVLLQPVTPDFVSQNQGAFLLANGIEIQGSQEGDLLVDDAIKAGKVLFSDHEKKTYSRLTSYYLNAQVGKEVICQPSEIWGSSHIFGPADHIKGVYRVEKIVSLSKYTIIGIVYDAREVSYSPEGVGHIFDKNGNALNELCYFGNFEDIKASESRRVLFIFKKIPAENVAKGSYSIYDFVVPFWIDEGRNKYTQSPHDQNFRSEPSDSFVHSQTIAQ